MGMGAGPVSLGRVSSHPNPSFDPPEKSLEVVLATEIASGVVRLDEMSPASARIDDRHFGPPPARTDVNMLSLFGQHFLSKVVLLLSNASEDVCLVGFGPAYPGEVSCSFFIPSRPEVSSEVATILSEVA